MDFDFTEEQLAVSEAAAADLPGHGRPSIGWRRSRNRRRPIRRGPVVRARQGEPARPRRPRGPRWLGSRPDRAVPRPRATGSRRGAGAAVGHGRPRCPARGAFRHRRATSTLAPGGEPRGRSACPPRSTRWPPAPATTRRCAPSATVSGWRLHGTAFAVPQAHLAARILVPAAVDGAPTDGTIVALVDPTGPGATIERATTTDHQIHPHLHMDGVSGRGRRRPGRSRRRRRRGGVDARPGPHRAVRHPARRDRGGGATRRRLPQPTPPIRSSLVVVPGHHAARRRCLHRHRGHPGHHVAGGVAHRRGPPGHRSRGRRPLVGVGGGPTSGARHPAPPRRPGRRHLLPDPPLFPVGQADRARCCRARARSWPAWDRCWPRGCAAASTAGRAGGWKDREPDPQ